MDELPKHLERFLPPEAAGSVYVVEGVVGAQFRLKDGFMLDTQARKAVRDFIFAAYDTGLPIKAASIQVQDSTGKLGLSVTLGANVAATQPKSTWSDKAIGPTIFLDWMKDKAAVLSNRPTVDRAYIGGPWAK